MSENQMNAEYDKKSCYTTNLLNFTKGGKEKR